MAEGTQDIQGFREVPACEILAKIEKGEPVEYDHVIIEGDLDIGTLNLPKYCDKPIITSQILITNSQMKGKLNFQNAILEKQAFFDYTYFSGYCCFLGVQFKKGALFRKTKFCDGAVFNEAKFDFQGNFDEAEFLTGAVFLKTQFNSDVLFNRALFIWDADFTASQFNGDAHFWGTQFRKHAVFDNAKFNKSAYFWKSAYFGYYAQFFETQFNGDVLTFKNAVFNNSIAQEGACRRAKNVLERNGDRQEAGYHFYREMEAKRRQKPWYVRYPEFFFIQLIFGYGVHPFRLMFSWFAIATIFAFFYLSESGVISKLPASSLPQPLSYFVECIYFSIVTAVTPGYGKYELTSWVYQVVASVEAILGTFMWAAFIATFARKYMK
jgi:hypothetical protein